MKKILLVLFTLLSITFFTTISFVHNTKGKTDETLISNDAADLSGDGKKEKILLKGKQSSKRPGFFNDLYIQIDEPNQKNNKISLNNGMQPVLQLADLNQDGINDILVNIRNEGEFQTKAYTFNKSILNTLNLPEPLEVESHFSNGYKANLTVNETAGRYVIDLKERKKYYEKLGLFSQGKLNEPTELTVYPFSKMTPIKLKNNETGLKCRQLITGSAQSDVIAYIDSIWLYKNGSWKLTDVTVLKKQ